MSAGEVIDLTDLPIPALSSEQVSLFSVATMHATPEMSFDVSEADQLLKDREGARVLGADFGGDKGTVRLLQVIHGVVQPVDGYSDDIQGNDGVGYLDTIRRGAVYAQAHGVPFGISWGGPFQNSLLEYQPKAKTFIDEANAAYGGDLRNVAPGTIRAVLNDGPAGVIGGATEAHRRFGAKQVLFSINGGGIGLGVLKDGTIWSTEAGHIRGLDDLNRFGQTEACDLFGATYVCLERIGANKAGIESQWQAATGSYARARDIEVRYKEGDELARDLYEHSATIVAHVLQGAANAFDIDLHDTETAIVCHGGAYKFPKYGERIAQILKSAGGDHLQLIMTKDYADPDSNACLDGAAIAALIA